MGSIRKQQALADSAAHSQIRCPARRHEVSIEPTLILAPNMSPSSASVVRRLISITASVTIVARSPGPNAPCSTPAGGSARLWVPHPVQTTRSSRCPVVTTALSGSSIT